MKKRGSKRTNATRTTKSSLLTRLINALIVSIICILVPMSIIAVIGVQIELSFKEWDISPQGIEVYLNHFSKYSALLSGTIATCAVYFGLLRLREATEANRDKVKSERFAEWKVVLEIRAKEIASGDPKMLREFTKVRWHFFNDLYCRNFRIRESSDLAEIFEKNFKNLVPFFESQNVKYVNLGGIYPTDIHDYSYDSFCFLFLGPIEDTYEGAEDDLKNLYLDALPTDRLIDKEAYRLAWDRWLSRPV